MSILDLPEIILERIVINVIIKWHNDINLPLPTVKIPTISGGIWDGANGIGFPTFQLHGFLFVCPIIIHYWSYIPTVDLH